MFRHHNVQVTTMWLIWVGLALIVLKLLEVSVFATLSWWWIVVPFVIAFLWFELVERQLGLRTVNWITLAATGERAWTDEFITRHRLRLPARALFGNPAFAWRRHGRGQGGGAVCAGPGPAPSPEGSEPAVD